MGTWVKLDKLVPRGKQDRLVKRDLRVLWDKLDKQVRQVLLGLQDRLANRDLLVKWDRLGNLVPLDPAAPLVRRDRRDKPATRVPLAI